MHDVRDCKLWMLQSVRAMSWGCSHCYKAVTHGCDLQNIVARSYDFLRDYDYLMTVLIYKTYF